MKKIQKGDKVIVISGADKGTISTVESVSEERVVVKGVNTRKKSVKGQGFVEKDLSIHMSNVAVYDEKAKAPSRIEIREEKGKKVRYYKKSGSPVKKS